MFIYLPTIDPRARDPLAVLCKDAGDLVDIDLCSPRFPAEGIDLMGNRERLLADNKCIEVFCKCRTVLVTQGLDMAFCKKSTIPDEQFKHRSPGGILPDGVALSPGKLVGGEPDGHHPARPGKLE